MSKGEGCGREANDVGACGILCLLQAAKRSAEEQLEAAKCAAEEQLEENRTAPSLVSKHNIMTAKQDGVSFLRTKRRAHLQNPTRGSRYAQLHDYYAEAAICPAER